MSVVQTCAQDEVLLGPEDEEAWKEAIEEVEADLPRVDDVTGQVHMPPDDRIIGRITHIKKDTKQEALSCYCRLHQCKPPMLRIGKAPELHVLLAWYRDGTDLPAGKAGAAEHIRMFRERCMPA